MEAWLKDPFFFGEDILNTLHIFAGAWLDYFMVGITCLGNQIFYIVALPLLYWTFDRGTTLKIGAVFLLSAALNSFMKNLYMNPRPEAGKLLPGISELNIAFKPKNSPGFPSGHTQGSVSFWGPVLFYIRKKPVMIVSALLILLIPYSRMYLGVHYLGDVIGGYCLGVLSLIILFPANSFFEKQWRAIKDILIIGTLLITTLLVSYLLKDNHIAQPLAVFAAMICGAVMASDRVDFNPRGGLKAGFIKVILGFCVIALLKEGLKPLLPQSALGTYFRYWLIGFWVTFGAPFLFSRFELLRGPEKIS